MITKHRCQVDFSAPGVKHLADRGGLLVTCHTADRDLCIKQPGIAVAEFCGAVHHLWQAGPRHIEQGEQIIIPVIFMDVIEAGAAGVGGVGDMHPAAGQTPDEEAVNGAETQLTGGGAVSRASTWSRIRQIW